MAPAVVRQGFSVLYGIFFKNSHDAHFEDLTTMYDRELDDIANGLTESVPWWAEAFPQWKGETMKRMPNPRGCPGSHERVQPDERGRAVCSFCHNDFRVRQDGKLSAHVRPR